MPFDDFLKNRNGGGPVGTPMFLPLSSLTAALPAELSQLPLTEASRQQAEAWWRYAVTPLSKLPCQQRFEKIELSFESPGQPETHQKESWKAFLACCPEAGEGLVVTRTTVVESFPGTLFNTAGSEAERQLQTIVEQLPVVAWTTDKQFIWKSIVGSFGNTADRVDLTWLLGKSIDEVLPSETGGPSPFRIHYERALAGDLVQFTMPWNSREYEVRLRPFLGSTESHDGVIGAAIDVTAQVAAKKLARFERDRFRLVFERAMDGLVVHDVEGRILAANPATQQSLGYSEAELLQMNVSDIQVGHPFEDLVALWRQIANGVSFPGSIEGRQRCKNGEIIDVEVRVGLFAQTDPPLLLACGRDISERKRIEQERAVLANRLETRQRLESLGLLAGGIAHDFNNLLTTILGNAGIVRRRVRSDRESAEAVSDIEQSCRLAADLCRQLLAYAGGGKIIVADHDISQIVGEMAHLLRSMIPPGVDFEQNLQPDLPMIEVDASQIRQVVMNLITNASEACRASGGSIKVSTRVVTLGTQFFATTYLGEQLPEGNYISIEVCDTGCGMPDEVAQRIFEPFYTTKFTGEGLGLAAVLGIVRQYRGAISVSSKLGEGSQFVVYLPIAEGLSEVNSSPRPASDGSMQVFRTIMIVEDEPMVRNLAARVLKKSGYCVIEHGTGDAALEFVARERPVLSAILLDLTMPGRSGVDIFPELRELCLDVPIVMTSGFSEQTVRRQSNGAQPDVFLQKPFSPEELLIAIQEGIGSVSG